MKQQLIKFNKINHDNDLFYMQKDIKAYNTLLQNILPQAEILNLPITKETLTTLLKKPKEFAFDTIVGENHLTVAGVKVNKSKAMDLIDFPDAWLKIIDYVISFNAEINKKHTAHHESVQVPSRLGLESLDLIDNKLLLSDYFLSELKERHSVYTKTEAQNEALKLAITIGKCFYQLNKMGVPVLSFKELSHYGFYNKNTGGSYEYGFDPAVLVGQTTSV